MDAIGQELSPGDIVIYTGQRSSGFSATVIKNVKANTVNLAKPGYGPTRKDKDNVIIITEEQLITMHRRWIQPDEDGMIRGRDFLGYIDGQHRYEEYVRTVEEQVHKLVRPYIQTSRIIKGIELGEYEPTPEEREKLKI